VAPVLILAAIAAFVFVKAAGIRNAPAAALTRTIRIEGHQFYWQFDYPNGAISVDTMRIPYNRKIELEIVSADVAHSWWVPALGGKMDAIPGRVNSMSFRADKLGAFPGQCAEFCGTQHAMMKMTVEVVPPAEYDAWVLHRKADLAAVGRESFTGVCAKCHGLAGQGGIGPPISQSPVLADAKALTLLLRNGRGRMPAVGKTWSDEQLKAVIAYLGKRFSAGGSSGG
jgi:cytochrome c oxidase subunit 2